MKKEEWSGNVFPEEEIDEFINLFDRKLLDEKFSDKKGKEDLFK